jgi:nucleoside-diphosphate-sugar epimerase
MNGKRVLVTGGSGFIGSHLVQRLLGDGSTVAVTVRYGNVMKNERLKPIWDRITVIEADLRNRGAIRAIQDFEPDVVFHLAAYNHVGESFRQVEECFDVNAKGTANLLDACNGVVKRFIYMSTSEVYGHQAQVPFVETMCPDPISPYAITKYAGELYCRLHQRVGGAPSVVILRPFNTFGPYQSSKAVIPELILACLRGQPVRTTKGEQTREFNYVSNIVDGLIAAAAHDGTLHEVINLAAAEEVKICDLVQTIAELSHTTSSIEIGALPYRPTEIWRMYADATRARDLLNWRPRVSLRDGLRETIEWYRQYVGSDAPTPTEAG